MEEYGKKAVELIMLYGPRIVLAILVLIIGLWIIKKLTRVNRKVMEKRNMDPSLRSFISSMINIGLKALLIISVAGMVGIETTSFIAILGAAGLAVGLALQGTLANFAGGVLILLFKPYKADDLIEVQGYLGVVSEIQIFVTIMTTLDSKTVIIPNGTMSNSNITNYTTKGIIRVDLVMSISYGSSIKDARNALLEVMQKHTKVMKDPAPFVGVLELGESAVRLAVRSHCHPNFYWDVYFDLYEQGKEALNKAGVIIAFPQLDVHLNK